MWRESLVASGFGGGTPSEPGLRANRRVKAAARSSLVVPGLSLVPAPAAAAAAGADAARHSELCVRRPFRVWPAAVRSDSEVRWALPSHRSYGERPQQRRCAPTTSGCIVCNAVPRTHCLPASSATAPAVPGTALPRARNGGIVRASKVGRTDEALVNIMGRWFPTGLQKEGCVCAGRPSGAGAVHALHACRGVRRPRTLA
jgi:hypothetical protein